jgi:hypothetical protein
MMGGGDQRFDTSHSNPQLLLPVPTVPSTHAIGKHAFWNGIPGD